MRTTAAIAARDQAMTPDPREDKLPRWAQDQIATLRRAVTSAERGRADAERSTDIENSDAVQTSDHSTWYGLGAGLHGQVRFLLDGPGKVDGSYVDVRVSDGRLLVHGDDRLMVCPRSSNSIEIVSVPRRPFAP